MINCKELIIFQHLKLFLCLLSMRLLYMCIVKSYFVPDEYWQSLEIAHKTVFGYGYITWEWDKAIRSFFYPSWFALCYKILEILRLDYVELLILVPRVLQSILSSIADLYFWCWLNKPMLKLRKDQIYWIYTMWTMCLLVNYCSSRTLTNTAELNFSVIAMYYFPWGKQCNNKSHFLWFVGLACLIRPTAFIQWLPLCVYDLLSNPKPLKYCLTSYLGIVCKIMCLSIIVDFLFYNRFVLTPLNFIIYNGQYNIGVHYGVHSWCWYIIVGIPVVLGPIFVLFYFSMFRLLNQIFQQIYKKCIINCNITSYNRMSNVELLCHFTVLWSLLWYSIVPHKEFRFILPLVPLMIYLAGINISFNYSKKEKFYPRNYVLVFISVCAIICNIIGLLYLGQWHQVGQVNVMSQLAQIAKDNTNRLNFLFLIPCHTVPFYSHLHANVTAKFLTCEPNFFSDEVYKDEADLFFENPSFWLDKYVADRDECTLPSHIIFFSNLRTSIKHFLKRFNYTQYDILFNSHFVQGRQSQYLEIFNVNKSGSCYS